LLLAVVPQQPSGTARAVATAEVLEGFRCV